MSKAQLGTEIATKILKAMGLDNCCSTETEILCEALCDMVLVPEEKWQRIQTLIETLDEECSACDKPRRCWLGCKVNFSVVFLRNILGEELRKTLIKE